MNAFYVNHTALLKIIHVFSNPEDLHNSELVIKPVLWTGQ